MDIHLRRSEDNGLTWGPESKILNGSGSGDTAGYGDAAVVADSESDKVRLVCVTGDVKFADSGTWWRPKMRIATILSEDNGRTWSKPVDITDMMYSIVDVYGQFLHPDESYSQNKSKSEITIEFIPCFVRITI